MKTIAAAVSLLLSGGAATAQVILGGGPRPAGYPHYRVTGFATGTAYPWPVRPWGHFVPAPLVVVVPQPVFVLPVLEPPRREPDPPPVRPAADWHVVRPDRGLAFPIVARPEANPAPAVGDRNPNPKLEAARQLRLAQTAFAADEYGRAVERLTEAIKARPAEPLPYFLLAQVRVARGEYAEAVAAVRDGLKLAPDWPASAFTPKPLYADDPAKFEEHLRDLRAAAGEKPGDVTLQFLLGHQLWFAGRRDEATKLFRGLLPRVKQKELVEAYLNVDDGRVVRK